MTPAVERASATRALEWRISVRHLNHIARATAVCIGLLLTCGAFALAPTGVIGRGELRQVEYLPDGRVLHVLSDRIDVVAPDLKTVLTSLGEGTTYFASVSVSDDGARVASARTSRNPNHTTLETWDIDAGALVAEWTHDDLYGSFTLNASLTRVVAYLSGEALVIDAATGAVLRRFPVAQPEDHVYLALSPDATLAFGGRQRVISDPGERLVWEKSAALWRVDTGEPVAVLHPRTKAWIDPPFYRGAVFSPDGSLIAAHDRQGWITLYDVGTRDEVWRSIAPGGVGKMAFSRDGGRVHVAIGRPRALGDAFRANRVWTRGVDGSSPSLVGDGVAVLQGATVSPDGAIGLLRYEDGLLEEWDIATNVRRRVSTVHTAPEPWRSALSADGRYISGTLAGLVAVWDVQQRDVTHTVAPEESFWRTTVASPTEPVFAIAQGARIDIRSFPAGELVARTADYFSDDLVVFSNDGLLLAFDGGYDGNSHTVAVADVVTGDRVALLGLEAPDGHVSYVSRLAFGAGHRYLAARDGDEWMYVWERQGEAYVLRHAWDDSSLEHATLLFEPRGQSPKLLISWQGVTDVWDVSGRTPVKTMTLDEPAIAFVEPSGDGPTDPTYLLTHRERRLSVWDWSRREKLADTDVPAPFAVTRDGSVALAWERDHANVWDLRELLPTGTVAVDPQGLLPMRWGSIRRTALLPNFPNPFNPETWIPFSLAESADVVVDIYDARGTRVRTLNLGPTSAGAHTSRHMAAHWDGRNADGETVGSGLYYYRLNADEETTRAMLLSK